MKTKRNIFEDRKDCLRNSNFRVVSQLTSPPYLEAVYARSFDLPALSHHHLLAEGVSRGPDKRAAPSEVFSLTLASSIRCAAPSRRLATPAHHSLRTGYPSGHHATFMANFWELPDPNPPPPPPSRVYQRRYA